MSESTIRFTDVVKKLPGLMAGMPKRLMGLGQVSRQKPDTPCGLVHCLETSVARHPNNIALIYEGRSYTYRELLGKVDQIAHYLSDSGTRKGDVVAIFIENRPELLFVIAAVARLGAIGALLNTSQRGKVLAHSINLVSPKRIVVGQELIDAALAEQAVLPKGQESLIYVADGDQGTESEIPDGWVNFHRKVEGLPSTKPPKAVASKASEPFCYFYTSGTTGLPKAAILTHGRFAKAYAGVGLASIQLCPRDRALVCLPFYHGTALAVGWGSVLAGHASLVLVRQFSASQFWQQVRDNEVTAFCYVGELCRYLLALPPSPEDRQHKVRLMFGNGLRPNIWKAFKKRFGIDRVVEFYGSSEGNVGFLNLFNFDCTVGFTTVPYAIVTYDLENDEAIRYEDGFMRRVRVGEAGLLLGEITDKSPFDGYTDPEKTERTILRNVFKAGDAWFNTGDLMRDQGYRHAQFVDRLGDTFRWKGENVSTTEVENVLSTLEHVLDGVVYGVEIPNTNGRAGMACVRLQEKESLDPQRLYKAFMEALPKYAVPIFVRVVQKLETTGTHKYKKTDLKKAGFDPAICQDELWVLLPKAQGYVRLDNGVYKGIQAGEYAF